MLAIGIGGSCRGWLPIQVPEFARHRRTLIFDYPGVAPQRGRRRAFTTGDLADTLAGLLDALAIERAAVLGAFMGGMIAQELALRHPERVERLVLVGTYARADAKRRMLLAHWRELARLGVPLEVLVRDRCSGRAGRDDRADRPDRADDRVLQPRRRAARVGAVRAPVRRCLAHDTLDRLHEIRSPTLVLCGRNDALTPPKFHRQLADEIPDARLVTFAYGAHLVMVEAAEAFNRAVIEFTRRRLIARRTALRRRRAASTCARARFTPGSSRESTRTPPSSAHGLVDGNAQPGLGLRGVP